MPLSLPHSLKSRWTRVIVVSGLVAWVGWQLAPRFVELPVSLFSKPEPGTRYLAADGTPLRQLLNDEGQRVADAVPFAQLPETLINATIAAEDKRFFQHRGVDAWAVVRAIMGNIMAMRTTSGASTITQQLIKISSPPQKRTLAVKLYEAIAARKLETQWSKQEIIAAYLNRISYGNLMQGCAAAADGYFHKPLSDLTAAECAFLAAIPQSPSRLNPFRNKDAVVSRAQWIIGRMKALDMLDREAFEVARDQPVRLQRFRGGFVAAHAVDLIQQDGQPLPPVVQTTLDAALQRRVEAIIANRLESLRERHVEHAACVVIENATGQVRALVGSRDYFASDGGQINGAWVGHSPGSALKPFTYALAFAQGSSGASIVPDLPIEYQTPSGLYRPENYDHRYYGPTTYRDALGNSLNVSAVRVLQSVGGAERLLDLLHKLHFSTLTEPAEHYGLGLTIGNAPVRLIELTNAYATIARGGEWLPWRLTLDPVQAKAQRVLTSEACSYLADILSDNQARVLTFGSRSPLRLSFRVAAKTGTSTNYRDNWTLGFTPEFTVGVWAGNFEGQPMEDVTGVTGAAPIFRDVFEAIHARKRQTWFTLPSEFKRIRIDPRNGKRLPEQGLTIRSSREELIAPGSRIDTATPRDYDPRTGAALLPPMYDAWCRSADNRYGKDVTTHGDETALAWHIVSPVDGLSIRLDPDLPNGGTLHLVSDAPGRVEWSCKTLPVLSAGSKDTTVILTPGDHEITARYGDETRTTRIHVQ